MQLLKLECPNCGGTLDISLNDKKSIFCPYCGEKFIVEDGKKEYTINQNIRIDKHTSHTRHTVNEADIIRAKTKDREQKNNLLILLFSFVGLFLLIGFCLYIAGTEDREVQRAIDAGKISAGSYEDYEGEPYKAVVEQLEALGFENISCVDLNDSGVMFWRSERVESVSIGGDTTLYKNDYFFPSESVIVKYH